MRQLHSAAMRITRAKTWLIINQPFYASLLLRLKFIEDDCPTMWTDGKNLGWAATFVDEITDEEIRGVLVHEVLHCVLNHPIRGIGKTHKKWAKACDYAINLLVKESGFQLPDGGLYDEQYKDMTADHIYNILPEDPKGEGDGFSDFGAMKPPTNEDGSAPSTSQIEEELQQWKVAVQNAVTYSKTKGKLPGYLKRLADDVLESKIPWQELLRNYMTRPMKNDYSWMRPNRRHIGEGLYLPSNYSEGLGEVVIAVDTSGSITEKELGHFAAEINSILEDTTPEKIYVIYCDSRINGQVEEYEADEHPITLECRGGGGTDFTAPFEWVRDNGVTPDTFVYLTDLYGGCSIDPPPYNVMWVSTSTCKDIPFGELAKLEI